MEKGYQKLDKEGQYLLISQKKAVAMDFCHLDYFWLLLRFMIIRPKFEMHYFLSFGEKEKRKGSCPMNSFC